MIKTLRLNKASMTVLLAATTLSGCATFKPPEIAYDTPPIEAKLLPEPESPVRTVERPTAAAWSTQADQWGRPSAGICRSR